MIGNRQSGLLFPIIGSSFIIFLGFVVINTRRAANIDSAYIEGTNSYVGEVLEVADTSDVWRKCRVQLESAIDSSGYLVHQEQILVYTTSKVLAKHDRIIAHFELMDIQNNGNPGEFDAVSYWRNQGIDHMAFVGEYDFKVIQSQEPLWYDEWRERTRLFVESALQDNLSGQDLAVALALVLGDKDKLNPETKNQFSSAGAMHVLAVSGLHVGIIMQILLFIFGRFPRFISKRTALVITLIFIWAYATLIGFPVSVVRASIMFSMLGIGQVFGRQSNGLNVLAFSAFIMLLYEPFWLFQIGFQLSFVAILGIMTLFKPISNLIYVENKWLKKIWEGSVVGLVAQITTLPLTLYYFHQFPNYFLLTNLGMMIFAGLILMLVAILIATRWFNWLSSGVGVVLNLSIAAMLCFVQFIERLPGSVAYGFDWSITMVLIAYGVLIVVFYVTQNTKRKSLILSVPVIFLFLVQFLRFQAMNSDEIILLNHNAVSCVVKTGGGITVFHQANEKGLERLKFLMSQYTRVRPGEVHYHLLGNGETVTEFNGKELSFIAFKNGVMIELDNDKRFVRTRLSQAPVADRFVIDLPGVPSSTNYTQLRKGALNLFE